MMKKYNITVKEIISWIIMLLGFAFTLGYSSAEFNAIKENQVENKQRLETVRQKISDIEVRQAKEETDNDNQDKLIEKHDKKLFP